MQWGLRILARLIVRATCGRKRSGQGRRLTSRHLTTDLLAFPSMNVSRFINPCAFPWDPAIVSR